MGGLSLIRMTEKRQPKGQRAPVVPPPAAKPVPLDKALGMAAWEVVLFSSLAPQCLICGGAAWVSAHEPGCPVERLSTIMSNSQVRPDGLWHETPAYIVKRPDGVITIHGIPAERWMYLDLDQRDYIVANKARLKLSVVKIKCKYHDNAIKHIVSPMPKGHKVDECDACFATKGMGIDGLKAAIKAATAASRAHATRGHKFSAQAEAGKARRMMAILKDVVANGD
jgi:hypothetical protein